MTRTQVQLPDPLYNDLKRIAQQQDWSLAEVIRRAGELYAARYPRGKQSGWRLPGPLNLGGDFLQAPETFRAEAEVVRKKSRKVISADTNIFVYAANGDSPRCQAANAFLEAHQNNRDFVLCELVLVELYMCLRNKAILPEPLSAAKAVDYCDALRSNPNWQIVDAAPEIRADLWQLARQKDFPIRRIIDARLGLSLVFHRVTEFVTVNVADFKGLGFTKVWNPLLT